MRQTVVLHVSHITYDETTMRIEISQASLVKDFRLRETSISLDSVSVVAAMPAAKQKGDTTIYYAQAYKISEDASAYDLITQRLAGVGVNDGKIEVQGQAVTEVMIDGKEYYKNDLSLALKNLPAYIISELQVFDKVSDYARITGFDDATNRTKAINIVTKGGEDAKVFGKVYGGYGLDNRYDAYGSVNLLAKRRSLSLFAQSNNINKQDFSVLHLSDGNSSNNPQQSPYAKGSANTFQQDENMQENMSSRLGDGVSAVTAAGLNYADQSRNGKFSIVGHYLFSKVDNRVEYSILDKYFTDSIDSIRQRLETDSKTMSHRANFKLEYQITANDFLVFKPVFSYQRKLSDGASTLFFADNDTSAKQETSSDGNAFLGMGDLNYVHKFGGRGHTLGANLKFAWQQSDEDKEMNVSQTDDGFDLSRKQGHDNANGHWEAKASYVVPLNRASKLKFDLGWGMSRFQYRTSTEQSDSLGVFRPDFVQSGSTVSIHQGVNGGVAYAYSRHGLDLLLGLDGRRLWQTTENQTKAIDTAFFSVLPFLKIKYLPDTRHQIHFNALSKLVTPTVSQLHEAVTVIDPSLSVCGNANLSPSTNYETSFRYVYNEVGKSQVFVCFAKYAFSQNHIATHRIFTTETMDMSSPQSQTLTYKNAHDAYSSFDMLLAYGFPIPLVKSNANVSTLLKHSKVPGFCNHQPTHNRLTQWNSSVTIGSNISEKVDFVIDLNLQYTSDRNEEFSALSAAYWTFSYGGQIKLHPAQWLKVLLECGHTGYYGTATNKYNALICNTSVSYLFGRQHNVELQFSVKDILDQDNNFYLYTTESYLRETSANVLGRHALLTLIYNFNKKAYMP